MDEGALRRDCDAELRAPIQLPPAGQTSVDNNVAMVLSGRVRESSFQRGDRLRDGSIADGVHCNLQPCPVRASTEISDLLLLVVEHTFSIRGAGVRLVQCRIAAPESPI
jgi:hypothetical protein